MGLPDTQLLMYASTMKRRSTSAQPPGTTTHMSHAGVFSRLEGGAWAACLSSGSMCLPSFGASSFQKFIWIP
jgi:hypothetical protein